LPVLTAARGFDVHAASTSGLSSWYDPSTGQRLLAMPDLTLLLIKEL
jgi:hypothetical protein